jgi:hypothetical protein
MRRPSFIGATALLLMLDAQAASVSVLGNWFESLGATDLVGGAGTDLRSPIESGASQVGITVSNTDGAPWALTVQRAGGDLPAGVTLAVRRTGSGNCSSLIGGMAYQNLGDQGQAFFSGLGDCAGVGIQLRLDGVSILQPPGLYGATVLYTVQ